MITESIKLPRRAKILIQSNHIYPIIKIHFRTGLVTVKESDRVYNTVSIKNVTFDFSDFSEEEIMAFWSKFY